MAFRMLRILGGYGLPGAAWEGWTVQGDQLIAPNGFSFSAAELAYLQSVLHRRSCSASYTRLTDAPESPGRLFPSLIALEALRRLLIRLNPYKGGKHDH